LLDALLTGESVLSWPVIACYIRSCTY